MKFLEYAGWGAVPVVQRLAPYLASVCHGVNGFLFDSTDELLGLLGHLVADAHERQRVRSEAHAYVQRERVQAAHAAERLAFYEGLMPAPGVAAEPARVFTELAGLEGAEVAERHLTLAHTRYESLLHDGLLLLQNAGDVSAAPLCCAKPRGSSPPKPCPTCF